MLKKKEGYDYCTFNLYAFVHQHEMNLLVNINDNEEGVNVWNKLRRKIQNLKFK